MKAIAIFFFSSFFFLTANAQDEKGGDSQLKLEEIFIGVWKLDLPDQKTKMDSKEKADLEKLDDFSKKKFWKKTESWVYVLDEERNFQVTWVENGGLQEIRGKWTYDTEKEILELVSEEEVLQYKVTFSDRQQEWKPISKSKEDFKVLYLKRLGQ